MRKKTEGGEIMKIRLVLYSLDRSYREHLVNYLGIHHGDTLEINIFDETHALEEFLKEYRADIILLDQELSCRAERGETLIRLSEERGMDAEEPVIYKYQRGELIYKAILNAFASGTDRILRASEGEGEIKAGTHLFLPLNGGAGASTAVKACAVKLASDWKVLYLNLELFGDCEETLKAEGQFPSALYAGGAEGRGPDLAGSGRDRRLIGEVRQVPKIRCCAGKKDTVPDFSQDENFL